MELSALDISIVFISVITIVSLGLVYGLKKHKEVATKDGYFLAGKSMPWWIIAASLFAANIGSEQFIGQAGTAADSGIAVALYELSAPYMLVALGWIFAPLYMKWNLQTTPEYLERRFNKYCRLVFVTVLILTHVLSTISSTLYAGSVLMEVVTGLTIWKSVPIIVLLTTVYTITGGLKAVMMTNALQTCILLTGGLLGGYKSLNLVGGISGLFSKLEKVNLKKFPHIVRPLNDRDFPWLGTFLALVIGSLRYWCLDQEMAQRVLSASSISHARGGTAGAAFLKLLTLFIIIFPGMVARLLFALCKANPLESDYPHWCEVNFDDSHNCNKAYPLLVMKEFPSGLKGLMIASFLAAMMSSLSSLFNSISAMFTYDIYARFFASSKELSPRRVVFVGRCGVILIAVLTLLWIPVIDTVDRSLFVMASQIMRHLGPPITAVFLCGVFVPHVNEQGALIGLLSGTLLGSLRLTVYLIFQKTCDSQVHDNNQTLTASNWIFCLNFHYFSVLLFTLVLIVVLVSSQFYPEPLISKKEGLVLSVPFFNWNTKSLWSYSRLESIQSSSHREENITSEESSNDHQFSKIAKLRTLIKQASVKLSFAGFFVNWLLPFVVVGVTTGVIVYFR